MNKLAIILIAAVVLAGCASQTQTGTSISVGAKVYASSTHELRLGDSARSSNGWNVYLKEINNGQALFEVHPPNSTDPLSVIGVRMTAGTSQTISNALVIRLNSVSQNSVSVTLDSLTPAA
jgi:hypothetical protein